jgi:hypothetical protein
METLHDIPISLTWLCLWKPNCVFSLSEIGNNNVLNYPSWGAMYNMCSETTVVTRKVSWKPQNTDWRGYDCTYHHNVMIWAIHHIQTCLKQKQINSHYVFLILFIKWAVLQIWISATPPTCRQYKLHTWFAISTVRKFLLFLSVMLEGESMTQAMYNLYSSQVFQ